MDDLFIDLRGLEPPEPMEQVLGALERLPPGQRLRILIDREPRPLYRILERNGYLYRATTIELDYEIVISQAA